jgi:hypothetical protein
LKSFAFSDDPRRTWFQFVTVRVSPKEQFPPCGRIAPHQLGNSTASRPSPDLLDGFVMYAAMQRREQTEAQTPIASFVRGNTHHHLFPAIVAADAGASSRIASGERRVVGDGALSVDVDIRQRRPGQLEEQLPKIAEGASRGLHLLTAR